VRLRIRSPKVENPGGDLVVLFPFPEKGLCPVRTFSDTRKEAEQRNLVEREMPVFRTDRGGAWSKNLFQKSLDKVVEKTKLVGKRGRIVCHSFRGGRGGIPSTLASQLTPEAVTSTQEWGRWRSTAYRTYTRHHITLKRKIFEKICKLLQDCSK